MLPDRPRLQVLLGGRDVSERCDQVTFSATDSGGYEIATLGMPSDDYAFRGAPILIRSGCETAWMGRVAERDDHSEHNQAKRSVGGEGLRALLRDTLFSMVYVDRALTQWGDPSYSAQIALFNSNFQLQSSQVASDATGLTPAIAQLIQGSWATPWTPVCEAWYDAGPGNLITQVFYSLDVHEAAIGTWVEHVLLSNDANGSVLQDSGNLHASAPVSGYMQAASPTTQAARFALLAHSNSTTAIGTQGATYAAYWKNVAVYGTHGLSGRGADPVGFYPSDIARHALSQCSGVSVGTIVDAIGFIAPHVVYRTAVPADQVIDDMAKLMGWTWGVWEPSGMLASQPRLDFRPPPTDATCVVSRSDCDQLDIAIRLGDLYNVCQVTFVDAAGTQGLATVTLPNPLLAEAGIATRTLQLDMGLASQGAASAFAAFALALSQVAARAAGSATLPTSVRLANGGSKPACLLRPGIDRIRISDLPDSGSLLDRANSRRDVFRISRVESTAARDGSISTVAELDNGANLLETLQARLALSAAVVGQGAS